MSHLMTTWWEQGLTQLWIAGMCLRRPPTPFPPPDPSRPSQSRAAAGDDFPLDRHRHLLLLRFLRAAVPVPEQVVSPKPRAIRKPDPAGRGRVHLARSPDRNPLLRRDRLAKLLCVRAAERPEPRPPDLVRLRGPGRKYGTPFR